MLRENSPNNFQNSVHFGTRKNLVTNSHGIRYCQNFNDDTLAGSRGALNVNHFFIVVPNCSLANNKGRIEVGRGGGGKEFRFIYKCHITVLFGENQIRIVHFSPFCCENIDVRLLVDVSQCPTLTPFLFAGRGNWHADDGTHRCMLQR